MVVVTHESGHPWKSIICWGGYFTVYTMWTKVWKLVQTFFFFSFSSLSFFAFSLLLRSSSASAAGICSMACCSKGFNPTGGAAEMQRSIVLCHLNNVSPSYLPNTHTHTHTHTHIHNVVIRLQNLSDRSQQRVFDSQCLDTRPLVREE